MSRRRLLVAALLLGLIAAFFALDLGQYFQLEYFKSKQSAMEEFRRANPLADRKSTRLNSSHGYISYAVFCLKKKTMFGAYIPTHSQGVARRQWLGLCV